MPDDTAVEIRRSGTGDAPQAGERLKALGSSLNAALRKVPAKDARG
ncbi:MAG: hypothetical protein NTW15_04750 [Burkholderiales bacterium]|nr:hypothetical protein [Burkholderiales bacterium]